MRWLVYEAYPDVGTIRLVLDNLNTHKMGSQAFEPTEARRIARRLELHYTPNTEVCLIRSREVFTKGIARKGLSLSLGTKWSSPAQSRTQGRQWTW